MTHNVFEERFADIEEDYAAVHPLRGPTMQMFLVTGACDV